MSLSDLDSSFEIYRRPSIFYFGVLETKKIREYRFRMCVMLIYSLSGIVLICYLIYLTMSSDLGFLNQLEPNY